MEQSKLMRMFLGYSPSDGNCYGNSINSLLYIGSAKIVVHGIVLNSYDGKKMMHAWAESDDFVYDFNKSTGEITEVEKEIFYAGGEIDTENTVSYTMEEVLRNVEIFRDGGPWIHWQRDFAENEDGGVWVDPRK